MSERIQVMTHGRPMKLIVAFALPLMLSNVFQQLYTVVDTMIVGKGLGVDALASLGAGDWLNWMMLGIMQGLTQGFGVLMAQAFGAGDHHELRRHLGCSILLAAVASVLLVIAGQLTAQPILLLLQTPEDILPGAMVYLRLMFAGIPIVMAYNLLAVLLRSLGDSKTPLQAMVIACILNIGLDLLFVLVFHWGIAGAAVATLIAQAFSGLYCLAQIRTLTFLQLDRSCFRLERHRVWQLLTMGAPCGLMNMIIAIGGMIIQTIVNGFGVLFIAGFTAANKLYGVLELASTSYGYAMTTYVGQNLGAGKLDRIRAGMKAAVILAVATALVIGAVMLLTGKSILSLFLSGTPQEVAQTMDVAYAYLSIMSICLPILYLLHVFRSAIQGMGNSVLPMISSISDFIMRTTAALLLPMVLQEYGVFFSEILAWVGACLILVPSYFITMRKKVRQVRFSDPA